MITTGARPGQRRAWDAAGLRARSTWRLTIPESVLEEFATHATLGAGAEPDSVPLAHDDLPVLRGFATVVRNVLVGRDGAAWIRGLGGTGWPDWLRRAFYVALGRCLGEPMTQYGVLYEVRDRGVNYRDQAVPVSMTGAATGFHTDSSARDAVPDVVGLLCEQPSREGGESLVSDALHAHAELERTAPDLLAVLYRDFVRDVVTPGVPKTRDSLLRNHFPVFAKSRRRGSVELRYMRYWIERGQEKAGRPLDATEIAAFDALDEVLSNARNVVRFRLEAGDMLLVDNRTVVHNRNGYRDHPGCVRRLQRMWIRFP